MKRDKQLAGLCRHLWDGMTPFRRRRKRALDMAYGRQWSRPMRMTDGRISSPEAEMLAQGREPVSNNLTRRLIKTVVGKWRYLRCSLNLEEGSDVLSQALDVSTTETLSDARALEEFLISGMTVQRVENGVGENISPARVFFSPFTREDGSDCRLMGILHDFRAVDMIRRFGGGEGGRTAEIAEMLTHRRCGRQSHFGEHREITYDTPDVGESVRVIELWQRGVKSLLRVHDTDSGEYYITSGDSEICHRLRDLNRERSERGRGELHILADVADLWYHIFMTTDGTILQHEELPEGSRPPMVVRVYPMVDGEIHSLVEDILPQQEYVNRLVLLLDETLRHSAKGVLLYPTDQLPHGMTWEDLRRIWSTPGAIIPFMRNSKNITPVQINSSGTFEGAAAMLQTQLELFGAISGTPVSSPGSGMAANSADMLRRQMEQESVALLDILSSFEAFLSDRDAVAGKGVSDV